MRVEVETVLQNLVGSNTFHEAAASQPREKI